MAKHTIEILQTGDSEWITFPGGELEGKRPKRLCPSCRAQLQRIVEGAATVAGTRRPLCFRCYRVELDREKALKAAGDLDTASDARFQVTLPFEPVNTARLSALMAERATARAAAREGMGQFVDRRRRAQIGARRALQTVAGREPFFASAVHAAELQLPESWLPFVVSR